MRDISERKKAEEDLRQSEKRFRSMIETGADLISLTNPDGKIFYVSPSISALAGYTMEQLLKISLFEFIHPDDMPGLVEQTKNILKMPGSSFFRQYRIRRKNGKWIWCEGTVINMLNEPGINALVSNFRDISERKITEKQQEFQRNNLTALINNTNDLMWSVDRDYRLITSNQPFYELVKSTSGNEIETGADTLSTAFLPGKMDRYKKLYERAFAGETFTEIEYIDTPVKYWTEISLYPIRKREEVIGTACYSRDITTRKLAELEHTKITNDLIQRNKDLEQFSYIISHNLRAPVANILGAGSMLNDPVLNKEKKDILSRGLNESVKKLDNVIKDLNHILQVKREINEIKEKVSFSKLVDDIKFSIKDMIDKDQVEITYDFSEIDECLTLKSYFYSIFYNLISNSIKYRQLKAPGIIEIKSHKIKDKFELIFTDNGSGIDLNKRSDQVFGLYKRFHSNIEGKGMGLFMVKTQVETLGGKITIKSEVDKGTEFKIEF